MPRLRWLRLGLRRGACRRLDALEKATRGLMASYRSVMLSEFETNSDPKPYLTPNYMAVLAALARLREETS